MSRDFTVEHKNNSNKNNKINN